MYLVSSSFSFFILCLGVCGTSVQVVTHIGLCSRLYEKNKPHFWRSSKLSGPHFILILSAGAQNAFTRMTTRGFRLQFQATSHHIPSPATRRSLALSTIKHAAIAFPSFANWVCLSNKALCSLLQLCATSQGQSPLSSAILCRMKIIDASEF